MSVGEFAFAAAQADEVEAQHGDAMNRQSFRDALGRQVIFAAGETLREQREGRRLAERQVEQRRQLLALGIGRIEALGAHG
jgi:hypothetical protein